MKEKSLSRGNYVAESLQQIEDSSCEQDVTSLISNTETIAALVKGDAMLDTSLRSKEKIVDMLEVRNPAPAAAGAAPPKNQVNHEARIVIYAIAAVQIFDHVFFCSS